MIRRFLGSLLFLVLIISPTLTLAQEVVEIKFAHSMSETQAYDYRTKAVIYVFSLASEPDEAVTVKATLTGDITGAAITEGKEYVIQPSEYKEEHRVKVSFGEGDDQGIANGEVGILTFSGAGIVSETYTISNIATRIANTNPNINNITANSDFPGTSLKLNDIFSGGITLFLGAIAIAAFGSLLYSGFLYMTAGGDAAIATKARKNILWALIAVVLALTSYVIIRTVADIPGFVEDTEKQAGTGATGEGDTLEGPEIVLPTNPPIDDIID